MSRTRVLYAGVVLFALLAVFTVRSMSEAWRARTGEARAAAVFDLVEQRTATRPTDAPGAMAWLRLQLDRYQTHIADAGRARIYGDLSAPGSRVPAALEGMASVLRHAEPVTPEPPLRADPAGPPDDATASMRRERLIQFDGRPFIVTRRRALDREPLDAETPSNAFIRAVVPMLDRAALGLSREIDRHSLPPVPGPTPPRPVRVYAVSEDGTLVSAPWPDGDAAAAAATESTLLAERPALPTFAPEEFFFRLDGRDPAAASYSGFYLDLGGRGLVSTILRPFAFPTRASGGSGPDAATRGVLALDLAFEIDWRAFAATIEAPVIGAAVDVTGPVRMPWTAIDASLGQAAPSTLGAAVRALAIRERQGGAADDPSPVHHGVVADIGAVAAFHVSDATWLVMLFPKSTPAFPMGAIALLTTMAAVLLAGFEINRRRAVRERRQAERALQEKQNLLNTMQVPLVVVDPNTDAVVSSNRAAESIGVRSGSRFADLVWPEPAARAHYEHMQVASGEARRAYGMPVSVLGDDGIRQRRYAIVRSVAVTAPIDALAADERHRLGILFVIEPEADLALLTDELQRSSRHDERRRLAGLLTHGVDTLARVLEHCLTRRGDGATSSMAEFTAWLSEYLERRLRVTSWLLDHWDATPPLARESLIDASHAGATLARLAVVFGVIARDRDLRSRLHWDNGALSAGAADPPFVVQMDWPETYECPCPVRGGFGFFIGEVLTNAMRHGAPGVAARVTITCERVRKELSFVVENARANDARGNASRLGETYGGSGLLTAMARLFEWTGPLFEEEDAAFRVSWRVPVSERGARGEAD